MGKYAIGLVLIISVLVLGSAMAPGTAVLAETPEPIYSLGLLPSPAGDYPRARSLSSAQLPPAVDLSVGLPSVGAQGRQASCVGWAVAYYYRSYQEGMETGRAPGQSGRVFSPAYLYNQRAAGDCARDTGMSMVDGLRIAVEQGVATLATMPYNANDACAQPSTTARAEAILYRPQAYLNLFAGRGAADLEMLKQHLSTGDPFLLALPVYTSFFRVTPSHALIDVPAEGETYYGGHAVTVVGYDDGARTFKFVNSWGANWGQGGYAHLTYDFVQQRAWEAWVVVDADITPPALPQRVVELGGTQSDVPQGSVSAPVFSWRPSDDPTVVYQLYWGADPQGASDATTAATTFTPPAVVEACTLYLRLNAQDPSGNQSGWRTMFTFRYDKNASSQPAGIKATIEGALVARPQHAPLR